MLKFIARRFVWTVPVLFAILVIVFLIMHTIPGGPFDSDRPRPAMANLQMDETTKNALKERFGLNDPLWKQFVTYMFGRVNSKGTFVCGLVCGNMGPSYRQSGRPIQDILFGPPKGKTIFESRFAYSLRLSVYAFLVALLLGVPLGILAATRYGTWLDTTVKSISTLLISLPNFVVGLLMIIILGGELHIIRIAPTNWQTLDPRVWFAPVSILSIGTMAAFIRLTRASLLEVMRRDFVRTAHSKGASQRRVVFLHILKNAMIPLITFSGPALLELFAGSFVIETMFGYPGMGREFVESVVRLDYSMIMGVVVIYAVMIAGVNVLVDLLYGYIDPRIRVE